MVEAVSTTLGQVGFLAVSIIGLLILAVAGLAWSYFAEWFRCVARANFEATQLNRVFNKINQEEAHGEGKVPIPEVR